MMKRYCIDIRTTVLCVAFLLIMSVMTVSAAQDSSTSAGTKTITDMADRTLTIPATITKVLSTYPPTTEMVYMLAPDKLMGWQTDETSMTYMPEKYRTLPVVGGWYGGLKGNYETFISMNPEVVFEGFTKSGNYMETINDRQDHLQPIPLVEVLDTTDVNNYSPGIKFLGDALGVPDKANELITFYEDIHKKVRDIAVTIPDSEKKKVYYAEGPDGLTTDPPGSQHAQLIDLCGGINVADVQMKGGMGMTPVSIEQVTSWNPDIIIVGDKTFYSKIFSDPAWQKLKAVQDKQVYLIPTNPFGWFDRPPCLNTIIGIPWTAKVLYPDKYKDIDLPALTKEYYQKFIHTDLSDSDVNTILTTSGLKNI